MLEFNIPKYIGLENNMQRKLKVEYFIGWKQENAFFQWMLKIFLIFNLGNLEERKFPKQK